MFRGVAAVTPTASEPAVRVLGSVSVEVDGRPVAIGGPLPRRLLAVLLANRGAVLSVDRLVEVLWGDEPPEAAASSLHAYVSRLRRVLPPSVRLETAAPGYRLRPEAGAADVERFEAALGDALACLAERPEAALAGLEAALSLWRGDAFAEFAEEWWAQGEAARLEELRLHAREAHAEALLALGRSEAAVSEARAVTADHPNRERAWRTLMVGLHRCGRQRDALRAAGEYRARLRDESGLDPSNDFAALEHAVAIDEPSEHTRRGNVTPPLTGLVGREDELSHLVGEVTQRRLVTLTGVGGVGKTRLATELAWSLVDGFPDGVWAVELAPVASPDAVAHAVAGMLSIRSQENMSMAETVADALRGRRMLLVLDNCEHVFDAVAGLAARITASCPTVALLATSREPIGVPAERVWPVPPLPSSEGGVELFCQRAAAADATFSPSDADLAVVATICDSLDGLPLAIELAAARVRSMTLGDLADQLPDRLRLLQGGRRGGPERHQTLRATVQWSYQLLTEDERLLFDRLAVFSGGCDVAAVGRCARMSASTIRPWPTCWLPGRQVHGRRRPARSPRPLRAARDIASVRRGTPRRARRDRRPARPAPRAQLRAGPGRTASSRVPATSKASGCWRRSGTTCGRRWTGRWPSATRPRRRCWWRRCCSSRCGNNAMSSASGPNVSSRSTEPARAPTPSPRCSPRCRATTNVPFSWPAGASRWRRRRPGPASGAVSR